MWTDSGQDPGGGPPSDHHHQQQSTSSNQELSDLKDQCEQQQLMIAQLKEILRKNEQSNVTQEKVDEYMNTLTRMNARVKKSKRKDNNNDDDGNTSRPIIDIPAKSKIDLLRQQVAENRAKFAERDKSQKGIEEMVTQIQAQLDDSQQWISQTPLNLSIQDNKIEYSLNSSSEELYNVLLLKEKRITDLVNKNQKLETHILDLQENLKEKDAVIDARTKAITLMTENLSKKSKGTLDALDETKEQMRKMQENFINLESEMKARQMKLLDDLRLKNYEIAELQELNSKLEEEKQKIAEQSDRNESEDLKKRIQELEELNKQLETKFDDLQRDYDKSLETIQEKDNCIGNLQKIVKQLENQQITVNDDNDEINKLKKQLDENNKNMIKIKAQSKSKIKELTKKLDEFKKISDLNAEFVKLDAENSKLNQKIAELEEEKGSLQLKLMESDNGKGTQKDVEEELANKEKLLAENLATISALETEIASLKTEIGLLMEKLNNSPSFEHVVQVKSEMTSIQFEEQLDDLRNENQKLHEIIHEKDEKIELLSKEKQELTIKLENYLQENMELIDKLEKLSAEKVSSAESIEIVENLTQQEKLELEAYQTNLDNIVSNNNNNNNNNSSSNNDNNSNNLKGSDENLPQVDLNETVNELTEETSELLQKIELFTIERREVMEKMEQLKHENNNLLLKMNEIENNRDILAETYEQLQNEKDDLIKRIDEIQQENERLQQTNTNSTELNDRIRQLVDENQQLLVKLEENEKLRSEQQDLEDQLEQIKTINEELRKEIDNLTNSIEQSREQQQLIIVENETLKKRVEELEIIKNDLEKLEWDQGQLLETKNNEIEKLTKDHDNLQNIIEDLQNIIKQKDENFNKLQNELKDKYLSLQKQLEDNSDNLENIKQPFERKIDELTNKNKEQLEKMKKIAANLKKKTQAYQELEDEYRRNEEKWMNESKEKDGKITKILQDLEKLTEKSQQFNDIEMKNIELQNTIIELRTKLDKTNEINLQQELLQTKENIIDIESNENLLKSKIQELEMLIETKDNELLKTNERIIKLEEGIRYVEERRMSLEKKTFELGTELEEKKQNYDEITKNEDLLEKRLIALVEHDEIIEKKLENSLSENFELNQQINQLNCKNDELIKKLDEYQLKLQHFDHLENQIIELENVNLELERIKQNFENDLKHSQNDYNKLKDEFDQINNDWQQQFDQMFNEKTELMQHCQHLEDELKDILNKENSFSNELILYKNKLENSEIEIRNYEEQIAQLLTENQIRLKQEEEINDLKQQLQQKNHQLEQMEQFKRECDDLRNKIDDLQQQLLNKTAENAITTIVEQAENRVNLEETTQIPTIVEQTENRVNLEETTQIPTIVWSDQGNDPFDFVTNQTTTEETVVAVETKPLAIQQQQQQQQEEDLQNKIKTLEFMLFNVGKERDDALAQCQQLTNELTKFVYDKITNQQLESQIIVDTDDQLENNENLLEKLEFEPTKQPVIQQSNNPIDEEICQQKNAYLCYNTDNKSPQSSDIDNQIITTTTTPTILEQQDGGSLQLNRDTFGENEDGWGWSPEECQLDDEHAQQQQQQQQHDNIELLQNRIRVLELERVNHLDEIKQLQIKSGKLIKKLKEFKMKNDELIMKHTTNLDNNLDDTIQEELKLQIQQIEKKLKETLNDLEKERVEKQSIQKKNDLLLTTNERMIEMKEKQEIELLGWQQNCRELNAKLERYEWGQDDGFNITEQQQNSGDDGNEMKINQLNETIKELTLDNDELQKLLEEQRQLRLDAEKTKIIDNTTKEIDDLTIKLNESLHKIEIIENENDKLNNLIIEKQTIIDGLNEEIRKFQQQLFEIKQSHKNELDLKDIEINSIRSELDKLNKNIENLNETININQIEILKLTNELEKRNEQIVLLNNEWQLRVDQRGIDVADSWKSHIDNREMELNKEIIELDEKCNALMNENNELRKNCDIEIRNEVDRIKNLQQQINDKQQIINDLTQQLTNKQLEIEQLNNNITKLNDDLNQLNQTIINRDDELNEKRKFIENILNRLHINLDDNNDNNAVLLNCDKFYKDLQNNYQKLQEIENRELLLKQELQQKNDIITNLTNQLQHIQNLKEYENENIANLQQNILEYQQINAQLQEKNNQYDYLNNQLQQTKDEIVDLKLKLQENDEIKQQNCLLINEQLQQIETLKQRLIDNENHYEELLNNKDTDLIKLQLELDQQLEKIGDYIGKLKKFDEISNELQDKINETIILQQKIDEQNHLLNNNDQQLIELRNIIEEQVMKIENLKQELYEKSNDYDSLIAEMDMNRIDEHKKIKEEYRQQQQQQQQDDDLSEPVSRAELDLALYMLHQRDVRCEELTVELTQLLEERDTLQLRLSNALREKEEICNKLKIDDQNIAGSSIETITTTSRDDSIIVGDSGELNKNNQLDNKISELKTVGYKRDKTIVDEQELRRLQEFSILQQHKDVAAKLPPEAAARLVDASYTLSRDVQSPSKVLLNWLWGKSTPKVNNI